MIENYSIPVRRVNLSAASTSRYPLHAARARRDGADWSKATKAMSFDGNSLSSCDSRYNRRNNVTEVHHRSETLELKRGQGQDLFHGKRQGNVPSKTPSTPTKKVLHVSGSVNQPAPNGTIVKGGCRHENDSMTTANAIECNEKPSRWCADIELKVTDSDGSIGSIAVDPIPKIDNSQECIPLDPDMAAPNQNYNNFGPFADAAFRYVQVGCTRASSSGATTNRGPSIAERSEAWLAYREQKRATLRERRESEICSFAPNLCRSERSNRWTAGFESSGDPQVRGMRTSAHRAYRQQLHEEQQSAEDLRQGTFAPNISDPLQPQQSTSKREKPRIQRHVTPERAAEFYGQQVAWREACLKQRNLTWEERCYTNLHEKDHLRQQAAHGEPQGVQYHTNSDRHGLSRKQRECNPEELRQMPCSEITYAGKSCGRQESLVASFKRSLSAPNTPRRTIATNATGVRDLNSYVNNQNSKSMRFTQRIPSVSPPRRSSTPSRYPSASSTPGRSRSVPTTPRAGSDVNGFSERHNAGPPKQGGRSTHVGPSSIRSASARSTPCRSHSSPTTPRLTKGSTVVPARGAILQPTPIEPAAVPSAPVATSLQFGADASGIALVERLKSSRLQHIVPVGHRPAVQVTQVGRSRSAPSTPRGYKICTNPNGMGRARTINDATGDRTSHPLSPSCMPAPADVDSSWGSLDNTSGSGLDHTADFGRPPSMHGTAVVMDTVWNETSCENLDDSGLPRGAEQQEEVDELLHVLTESA